MKENIQNRRLLWMCFLAYFISYVGKYSYSTNIQNVIADLQINKASAGIVSSAFFFCYGIGQLLNGILCERFNSKWTITSALCISGLINFVMFFLRNVFLMAIIWGINGLVLSVLWSHCMKILATIEDKNYLSKSVTVMSLTVPVGVIASYVFSAAFTGMGFWRLTYLVAAGLLIAVGGIFRFNVGLVEKERSAKVSSPPTVATRDKRPKTGSLYSIFGILIFPLTLICISIGIVRDGAATWMPVILTDVYAMPGYISILLTVGLPLTGTISAWLATKLMDKTGNVFLSSLIAGATATLSSVVLTVAFDLSVVLLLTAFMLLSVAVYVLSNTMTALLPLYYKEKLKSGQAAGLINACVYLGSAAVSLFSGDLVAYSGWKSFMVCMLICSLLVVIASIVSLSLTKMKKKPKEKFKC